ncbi:hypothetical protein [Polaromonas sp. LjRoot131]|uniref:hypothetical protein n=1 Tax=Polaromonas sp. LjRoot131 TaxID=3342262 RepID=UPI003ED02EE3
MTKHWPFWIYLIGLLPLAYWQEAVRAWLGDWLSFALAIGYLLFLRLLGFWAARWQESGRAKLIAEQKGGRKP